MSFVLNNKLLFSHTTDLRLTSCTHLTILTANTKVQQRPQGQKAASSRTAAYLATILALLLIAVNQPSENKGCLLFRNKEICHTLLACVSYVRSKTEGDSFPTQARRDSGRHSKIVREHSPKKSDHTLQRTAKVWRSLSKRNWSKPQRGQ